MNRVFLALIAILSLRADASNLNSNFIAKNAPYKILQRHYRHDRDRHIRQPSLTAEWSSERVRHECDTKCRILVPKIHEIRSLFQDYLDEFETRSVHFKVQFLNYENYTYPLLEDYPYMGNSYSASDWVWTSGHFGRKLLGLPLDSDVLSLYMLNANKKLIPLEFSDEPSLCMVKATPECRLHAIREVLIHNVTYIDKHHHRRDFVCHHIINQSLDDANSSHAQLLHRCCDTVEFRNGHPQCTVYTSHGTELTSILVIINIIAIVTTLFSPLVILKIKLACKYDHVTKFFRASLKHGITGQRNYVIRVSSRQLINLNDSKPFSLPRSIFRLIFHCYGEGRCCIHWWGEWRHQPNSCQPLSLYQRAWFNFWRFFAIFAVYPSVIYLAVALYAPNIPFYISLFQHCKEFFPHFGPLHLHMNMIAVVFVPFYDIGMTVWMGFSFLSFIYTTLLLSWPSHPLERCLLRYEGKRPMEQTNLLYTRLKTAHKGILSRLAYGDESAKRHFFRVSWIPHGVQRTFRFLKAALMEVPIFNICCTLVHFRGKDADEEDVADDDDDGDDGEIGGAGDDGENEESRTKRRSVNVCLKCCKFSSSVIAWLGFSLLLLGYCTITFLIIEFTLNVLVFVILAVALHASTVLPWICCFVIICLYLTDALNTINSQHREILQLIDANSPRISAMEDGEQVFRGRDVQILKAHNLGAVKFIDGDSTEYVSKELYYNVCADLKSGWTHCVRRLGIRMTVITLYIVFIFSCVSSLTSLMLGLGIWPFIIGVLFSSFPKYLESYFAARSQKPAVRRMLWAKLMPEILDRHIRVDRSLALDEREQELTTYDVRPVGILELDMPSATPFRSLRLWKFAWVVSADQQTQSHESFIIALANKLAAASFLSKVVTRAYSPMLVEEAVLRQWCLLVENCILEGSATASSINGVPVESVRLFPRDVQALVSTFDAGNTIDNAVDSINRQLYGPFTKGVLVTIGNTSLAIANMDNTLFAFNGSCHGDQVTDLFGAVLIATEFNTQNLQSIIKYIVDPYSPDSVPVYSIVPIEGFVFKSPEILEVDLPM